MQDRNQLTNSINKAKIISFDVFDTLLFRKVPTPESVFKMIETSEGIKDFFTLRQEKQAEASIALTREKGYPHANLDEIYSYIEKTYTGEKVDWEAVKEKELSLEKEVTTANKELLPIIKEIKEDGKRIIITSDMYLSGEQIADLLRNAGFPEFDAVYSSADCRATKYNKDIFDYISKAENIDPSQILHIGDKRRDDHDFARQSGWEAFHYVSEENAFSSDTDFWFNFGARYGGPLYLGLFQWLTKEMREGSFNRVFCLSRDGYNIAKILNRFSDFEAVYLYSSRRAMLLAGITEMDEEALRLMPPFTFGQTVKEILEYLDLYEICKDKIVSNGFESELSRIKTLDDFEIMHRIYLECEEEVLKKCALERENMRRYLDSKSFDIQDTVVFDCGWNGSSQLMLDRFFKAQNKDIKAPFLYAGIINSEKSNRQLSDKDYEAYLFDRKKNEELQEELKRSIAVLELFFGAPENSIWRYTEDGPEFETGENDESYKTKILEGMISYLSEMIPLAKKYSWSLKPREALSPILKLIKEPTLEEAKVIGDIPNVDGYSNQSGEKKYMAYLTPEALKKNPRIEVQWEEALFTRDDIEFSVKEAISKREGIALEPYLNDSEKELLKNSEPKESPAPSMDTDYEYWIYQNESDTKEVYALDYEPMFSVVVPVYNTSDDILSDCFDSVLVQTYKNFELILVDDCSTMENVRPLLESYRKDPRVRIHYRDENGHISKTTNDGIEMAQGEFIAFCDCDDVLPENALFEFAKLLNENRELDFIYSDEDKISENGEIRHFPFFKPDWSPDLFMDIMYTNHLGVYRTRIVKRIGGLRPEFDGSQDYDFTMRFLEQTENSRIGHIPKVLYHWRETKGSVATGLSAKPYVLQAMKTLKEEALFRRGWAGHVSFLKDMQQYVVVYDNRETPLVSIIIPSKDNPEILKKCIDSIRKNTIYPDYEIIVVDNGSSPQNRGLIEDYLKDKATYIYEKMDFNFSKMCNMGAAAAKGEYYLLLNDDIKIFQEDWLNIMVGHASLPHTGAVGVKLLYPDSDLIQHDGILNLPIGPSHTLLQWDDKMVYYYGRNRVNYNYIAVTAACLMVNAEKYKKVGGLNEDLPVAYNDVDFCFKLYETGYYNVIRNDVRAYHYESLSRGSDDMTPEKQARQKNEMERLYKLHENLRKKDPFYSVNFGDDNPYYGLKIRWDGLANEERIKLLGKNSVVKKPGTMFFDAMVSGENIIIQGWAYTGYRRLDEAKEKTLCLEVRPGVLAELYTLHVRREDAKLAVNASTSDLGLIGVMKNHFENDRNNTFPIWVKYKAGKKEKYCRGGNAITIPIIETSPAFKKVESKDFAGYLTEGIEGSLDYFSVDRRSGGETFVSVRGWTAIFETYDSNIYTTKKLVHRTPEGELFEAELSTEIRYDLTAPYPDFKGILWSGFRGTIPLKFEGEYGEEDISSEGEWSVAVKDILSETTYLKSFKGET